MAAKHTRQLQSDFLSQSAPRTIAVAYSDDSAAIFTFFAWINGHITLPDCDATFMRNQISFLNQVAAEEVFDIVNISSAMYPLIADRYWILATGSSLGQGYGPTLFSKNCHTLDDLKGKRIAVADISTTGGALAMMFCPEAEFIAKPYHLIANAIFTGEFDAGVMIHEEMVYFQEMGLRPVCNLGEAWLGDTGLPLPVGLSLVRKKHGRSFASKVQRTCRASLRWTHEHYSDVQSHVSKYGRNCANKYVPMFSNDDTLCLPDDARAGLDVFFDRVVGLGLGPELNDYEVIDD